MQRNTGQAVARGTLVVAHPDRKAQRALHRLVGATWCPVAIVAEVDALPAAVDETTIAVVDAALAHAHPELVRHPARAWIAVPGDGQAPAPPETVAALLAAGWHHVIAHPMPLLGEELLVTVQTLLRGEAFGLERYMTWGAEVRSYALEDACERDSAVAALAKDVVAAGLPDRVASLVSVIADELIANALYVAPIDEAGARFRAHEPRDRRRALAGRDAVTLRWATDGRYLAVEVRDRWGSVDLAQVTSRLTAGVNQAGTGADGGMGLPLAYACCNQLVVGCAPGALTEVIALVDVRYKPTELARSASFHAFVGTGRPPEGAA